MSCITENLRGLNFHGKQVVQSGHTSWQHGQQQSGLRKRVCPPDMDSCPRGIAGNTAAPTYRRTTRMYMDLIPRLVLRPHPAFCDFQYGESLATSYLYARILSVDPT